VVREVMMVLAPPLALVLLVVAAVAQTPWAVMAPKYLFLVRRLVIRLRN